MPSGSHSGGHGGGGGSHGGGRSGGGGSHSGSSMSSRHPRGYRNGRAVVFFGSGYRRRYMSSGVYHAYSVLISLSVFAIFFALILTFTTMGYNSQLKNIKADYMYYQDMIEDAEDRLSQGDSSYFVDGRIISKFENENCGKWYVTYYFLDQNGRKVEGYTYSIYTWNEVKDMDAGEIIKLVVDSNPITQDTDSINYDYKDTTLSDDGEYIKAKNSKQNATITYTILYIVAGAMIIGTIVMRFTAIKNDNGEDDKPSTSTYRPATYEEPKKRTRYCRYCGAAMSENQTTCNKCGGSSYNEN